MIKQVGLALFASCVFLLFSGSGGSLLAAEKVLTISLDPGNAGQDSFNPFTTNKTSNIYYLIYDRLVEMGADGTIYPHLLESWDVSDDGLAITFTLKKGTTFHDGSELNAEVLKWFLDNLAEGNSKYMVAAVESIDIKDNLAVVLNLSRPDPNILYNFTSSFTGIPSKVAIEKYGEDFGRKHVVGTGPFEFVYWKTGDEIVLKKNPDYQWASPLSDNQGPAKVDNVVFKEIEEASTRFLEFQTGGVDILEDAPTLFLKKLENNNKVEVITMPSSRNFHMVMNTKDELLSDLNIRKAIALAVKKEDILTGVFQGAGTPAYTYLIDRLPARNVDKKFEIHYDLQAAKAILDNEGWKAGGDGILAKDGKRLSLSLWSKSDSTERKIAEMIQAQLSRLGVEIEIEQFDPSSIRAEFKKGEHDLVVRSYDWDNADILEWFFNSTRIGYPNVAMWHDNESDYLMHEAMTRAKNLDERVANFKEYHEYLLSQYIWAPIVNPVNHHAINSSVTMPSAPRFKILIGPPIMDMTVN